jgi:pSer/pThr/pTyr-binding forkhead associated (FHA) protein
MLTRTDDPGAGAWLLDDEVTRLREWGSDRTYPVPPPGEAWTIGAADTCALRLVDPSRQVSREHARLFHDGARWAIADLESKNGTRLDGARRHAFPLGPGAEVGFGKITLIAEGGRLIALRRLLARLLGLGAERTAAVDRALRTVRTAALGRGTLVLCGERDLVPIARTVHLQMLGEGRPFVICDPRRAAVRHREGLRAMEAATGGTMCVRARRLPPDFEEVSLALRNPAVRVRLVVCTDDTADPRVALGDAIVLPPLARRRGELDRIIDEYARDAIEGLGAGPAGFTHADRAWVIEHAASSLPEIEKATRRLVAIRQAGSIAGAAARLGMSHVALAQWIARRRSPRGTPGAPSAPVTGRV